MENLNTEVKNGWNRQCLYSAGFLIMGIMAVILFIKGTGDSGAISNWILKVIFNTGLPFTPQQFWWRNLIDSLEFLIQVGIILGLFMASIWTGISGVKKARINNERGRWLGIISITLVIGTILAPILARVIEILFP